jgi:hypothetical protein
MGTTTRLRNLGIAAALLLAPGAAAPLSLSLSPAAVDAVGFTSFHIDLVVSGLGASDEVAAFDVDVLYDAGFATLSSVEFGTLLGDPTDPLETVVGLAGAPGVADLGEFSLLAESVLEALQPGSFTLATLHFDLLVDGPGESALQIAPGAVLGDADGVRIAVTSATGARVHVAPIPEPGALLLFAVGLAVVRRGLRTTE